MGEKTFILIRDDDISCFTDPRILERVHGPLLRNNLPLNLAVIPSVRSDIKGTSSDRIYFREEGIEYEPFIPVEKRGLPRSFSLMENSDLCSFLRGKRNITVLQHGYSHVWDKGQPECSTDDVISLRDHLVAGQHILRDATGEEPQFLVPPWDAVSAQSLGMISRLYRGISLKDPRRKMFPLWRQWQLKRSGVSGRCLWYRDFLLVGHPGYVVSRFNAAEYMRERMRGLLATEKVIVLNVHHWEFFFDWAGPDERFLAVWHEILEGLVNNPDITFLSFSQLYDMLKG